MKSVAILLFCFSFLFSASADVDLKTGDFHVRYTDIDYTSIKGIAIQRAYNSASRSVGLFGYGWTSLYETKLYVIGDGNILIKEVGSNCKTCAENGSGNASILIREKGFFELFFRPAQPDRSRVDNAVGQIIQMLIKDRKLESTPVEIAKKRKELLESMSKRAAEWVHYTEKGWIKQDTASDNTKWFSTNGELQNIVFKDNGYVRHYNDKSYETFNAHGYLLDKYDDKGKLSFAINYTNNKADQIRDGAGNIFRLQLNESGVVSSIKVKHDIISFEYDAENCLIKSFDAEKIERKYTYNERNILVLIESQDSRSVIEYDPRTFKAIKIKEVKGEENQSILQYRYDKILKDDGSVDPYRFSTTVFELSDERGESDSTYNEYELKEILGRPYTYKTVIKDGGIITETVFTECGCGPLSIRKGSKYAAFKYDGRSRMIEKDNNEYVLIATYDNDLSKITRIERKDKSSGDVKIQEFAYSPQGDVIKMSSEDMVIHLHYNEKRSIVKMETPDDVLLFKYNSINKPIEIRIENQGSISVTYDEKGEIEKVDSPEGHGMALKVTQAFQNLLNLAKPQGFDYRMI